MIHLKYNSSHATTSLYGGTNSNIYKTIIFFVRFDKKFIFFCKNIWHFPKNIVPLRRISDRKTYCTA